MKAYAGINGFQFCTHPTLQHCQLVCTFITSHEKDQLSSTLPSRANQPLPNKGCDSEDYSSRFVHDFFFIVVERTMEYEPLTTGIMGFWTLSLQDG